ELVGDVRRRHRPEQRPGRPGLHVEAQDGLAEHLGDLGRLLGRTCLVPGALLVDALDLRDPAGRRDLREPPREQVVAGVAALDVDDLAAQAELLDVLEQDDLHRYPDTYGSSAISRARFTATATIRWCRRQAPVIRRLRILPFSEM